MAHDRERFTRWARWLGGSSSTSSRSRDRREDGRLSIADVRRRTNPCSTRPIRRRVCRIVRSSRASSPARWRRDLVYREAPDLPWLDAPANSSMTSPAVPVESDDDIRRNLRGRYGVQRVAFWPRRRSRLPVIHDSCLASISRSRTPRLIGEPRASVRSACATARATRVTRMFVRRH